MGISTLLPKTKYRVHFKRFGSILKQRTVLSVAFIIGALALNFLLAQSVGSLSGARYSGTFEQAVAGVVGGGASTAPVDRNAPIFSGDGAVLGAHWRWNDVSMTEVNEAFLGFVLVQEASLLNGSNPLSNALPGRNGLMIYKVEEGDNLSKIASNFGISVETVLWANDISRSNLITVGQELVILPVSGVVHTVRTGETVESIAALYNLSSGELRELNRSANFLEGESIIIPGGKPRTLTSAQNLWLPDLGNYFSVPIKGWNWGRLHRENAVDIANACGTPIRAAAEGLVSDVGSPGKWNGGFGGYVEIEHPIRKGVKTRYVHTEENFVSVGDYVEKGQVIAEVGSTGNTHGPTGCHVHFEVIGAKNPFGR